MTRFNNQRRTLCCSQRLCRLITPVSEFVISLELGPGQAFSRAVQIARQEIRANSNLYPSASSVNNELGGNQCSRFLGGETRVQEFSSSDLRRKPFCFAKGLIERIRVGKRFAHRSLLFATPPDIQYPDD